MSKESLPLKIRADIRDLWDSPNSSLHEAITNLEKTLGHKIAAQAEWPALWTSLQARFPDKATFVPTIARYAIGWYERLLYRLENDVHAAWTEEILNILAESKRHAVLKVEVCGSSFCNVTRSHTDDKPCPSDKNTSPFMAWNTNLGSFCLGIPSSDPIPQSRLAGILDASFDSLFTGQEASPASILPAEDDWADVAEDPAALRSSNAKSSTNGILQVASSRPAEERLPSVDTLPRPNELFKTTAPHIMTINHRGDSLSVQCSHQQTLELLTNYLTKWAKTNPNDSLRRPMFKFDLLESDFTFGIIDTLQIEPNMKYHKGLNPAIVLAFVEGVLGYTMVHTTGSTWMYRSATLLK
ncbi:hypothetical protein V5O48_007412 [Marasmius crinis-equi]|uniref:Uncharacterized protein n=1 Tax=Marasmius crinis-equi TaxID=585013 RepID=A0ABR3FH82_9AGAR